MGPNIHLIVHNIICIISGLSALGLALFTYLNGPKKTVNIAYALMIFSMVIFIISHVLGASVTDHVLSQKFLMANLSIIFIAVFGFHGTIAITNREKELKGTIIFVYCAAVVYSIFFIIFPDLFLLPSVPKMYFPNYYNPGILNWTRMAFVYGVMVPYIVYQIFVAYLHQPNIVIKRQYLYLTICYIIGWGFGALPNLLVYNVQFDPAWGMAFVMLFSIPFVYGAVRYGMLNIKVIAQQAFYYSIGVVLVGGFIVLLEYSNTLLSQIFPGFPTWVTAFISGILAVTISIFIWRSLRQNDILKYEFITTVTHKFRTPLTYIKWAAENLTNPQMSAEERQAQVNYIQSANQKLVELTDILANASDAGNKSYEYKLEKNDFSAAVDEVITSLLNQFESKHIIVLKNLTPHLSAMFDAARIKFVVQVFLENAHHYTPPGGTLTITSSIQGNEIVFSVHDSGIGMSKDQLSLIFSKFYRSDEARKADTEGMGIGLYISKEIITRHNGKIDARSEGENKGSTFMFTLPLAK